MLPQSGNQSGNLTGSHEQKENSSTFPNCTAPKTVIFCDQSHFVTQLLESTPHVQCEGCFSKLYFFLSSPEIAIGNFGIGSTAASKMEELIAWGVREFIYISTAGALHTKAKIGDIVVCEKAVRDEMTSGQYLPPSKYIHAPRRMTNKLLNELKKASIPCLVGSTWTIDNPARTENAAHYQKEGILIVEMQAASLFAVAHFYQVDLGAMFAINDSHTNFLWESGAEEGFATLKTLLNIALDATKSS